MFSLVVVEQKVLCETVIRLMSIPILIEVHLLVFNCPPEPLDENIIKSSSSAIHADLDLMTFQYVQVLFICELTSLISI